MTPQLNILRLEKKNESTKDRIIRDVFNLFENWEDYYKPVRVDIFSSNNYIRYESNSDRNKTLLVEEYINKIRSYLKDINNLKKFNARKIQLTVTIIFVFSKYNDEERVMDLKRDSKKIMIIDKADEVIAELFESLF